MAIKREPKKRDQFTNNWIIQNSIEICERYRDGLLTIRALHYQLVGIGMTNSIQHYKRVAAAMSQARWAGQISFYKFSDHDRVTIGKTKYDETNVDESIESAKSAIENWMTIYYKNKWENQPYYPEVWIEKKALQGIFQDPCNAMRVLLAPCKGYPSLTFLNDAKDRFEEAESRGKKLLILYFGDYDPSGEDIPRSVEETLQRMGVTVEVKRIALMEHQVREWKLPPAPAKLTDSRTANWDGLGQVELDAIEPKKLMRITRQAIEEYFDKDLYSDLLDTEEGERKTYIKTLKDHVINMEFEDDEENDEDDDDNDNDE